MEIWAAGLSWAGRGVMKLQYFGNLMQRTDPLEKTLMLGKIEGRMRRLRVKELMLLNCGAGEDS